LILYRY